MQTEGLPGSEQDADRQTLPRQIHQLAGIPARRRATTRTCGTGLTCPKLHLHCSGHLSQADELHLCAAGEQLSSSHKDISTLSRRASPNTCQNPHIETSDIPGLLPTSNMKPWPDGEQFSVRTLRAFFGNASCYPRHESCRSGSIVNVASMEAIIGHPLLAAYNASKAGVHFSQSQRPNSGTGITCSCSVLWQENNIQKCELPR